MESGTVKQTEFGNFFENMNISGILEINNNQLLISTPKKWNLSEKQEIRISPNLE